VARVPSPPERLCAPPVSDTPHRPGSSLDALGDDAGRAARLAGASAAHRYSQPREPVDARVDAVLDAARARCGADLWDAAAREGATLSFEDAIGYAPEQTRDQTSTLRPIG
jgi:hypothetical protein